MGDRVNYGMKHKLAPGLDDNSKKESGAKSIRLFGLIESVIVESIYSYINPGLKHMPVRHDHLFKKLGEYDPNLSVGLEMSSGKKRHEVPPLVFETQRLHLDLLHHFKSKGNRLATLLLGATLVAGSLGLTSLANAAAASGTQVVWGNIDESACIKAKALQKQMSEKINETPDEINIERRYKSVKEGRITDGSPNYIGTWDLKVEPRGLFEFYLDGGVGEDGKIKGTIEDCFGTATFSGEINSGKISFTKVYVKVYNNDADAGRGIFYEGHLQEDGNYVGEYYGGMYISGKFKMKACK